MSEDCSVDDVESVYNKIEEELTTLEGLFDSVDYSDPKAVNDVLDKANSLFGVITTLGQTLGADLSGIDMGNGTANTVAGIGIATTAAIGTIGAVGSVATTGTLTVAGAISLIPVAGQVIAVCALVVAGISWLIGHNQQKS